MMSANAVLMKFFKLPPAVRMMLALLGFGSLAAILFRFMPGIRSTKGLIVMAIIFGVGLVLFLIYWLFRRMFRRKKSAELGTALESQGPSRGDIAEQEKIYREKFNSKLADLKANGLSVYHLPWFVLMGEPGCGKTASLINSGLDFPLGKDEVPGFGGTRNYNWWFSNEAVILDTAGRIAFQEEGTTDKVEWEYFVKLLRRYRPRCPINGVIIAIPADKLLRDSSEERAQKATILRERLRQVHQLLGVRFPTFVLVTKMDLAGGFGEFFEEIRVDLQQRNQMFGWSRSGEFQEAYDPADFLGAFDTLYYRVRDWGMRYLQRKATEEELGLIVTFPESFRQLRDPLNDYVSTIFQKSPLLEPPFFRGFYFTSAVQEGAPIFDVFARSSVGHAIAERPAKAVDSKAFFIHDLYANKVFPEQGLVFRSAKHVTVNRRMRRIVWIGSAAMILIMLTFFGFGSFRVNDLVTNPRVDCKTAHTKMDVRAQEGPAEWDPTRFRENVNLAQKLQGHYEKYNRTLVGLYARMLFIGASIAEPRDYVREIHRRFVLDCILAPVVRQAGLELQRKGPVADPTSNKDEHRRYVDALCVYTQWYGEMVGQHKLGRLTEEEAEQRAREFERLLALVKLPGEQDRVDARAQFEFAMRSLSDEARSFAREILDRTLHLNDEAAKAAATETIRDAVGRVTDSWMDYTKPRHDPGLKYWVDFVEAFAQLERRYGELLDLGATFEAATAADATDADRAEKFAAAVGAFNRIVTPDLDKMDDLEYPPSKESFAEAYQGVVMYLRTDYPPNTEYPPQENGRILGLEDVKKRVMSLWEEEFRKTQDAISKGAPAESADEDVQAVYSAINDEGKDKLEKILSRNIGDIRKKLNLPLGTDPHDHYESQLLVKVEQAQPGYEDRFEGKKATISIAESALGPGRLLGHYLTDMHAALSHGATEEQLGDLTQWKGVLAALGRPEPPGKHLGPWIQRVTGEVTSDHDDKQRRAIIADKSHLKDWEFWQPPELYALAESVLTASQRTRTAYVLSAMAEKARATIDDKKPLPGLARLMPEFDKPANQLPFERNRFNAPELAPPPEEPQEQPAEEQERAPGELRRIGRPGQRQPETPEPTLERGEPAPLLHHYHTRKFLIEVLREHRGVQRALEAYPSGNTVLGPLDQAARVYVDAFFEDWNRIYSEPTLLLSEQTLALLEQCSGRAGKLSWPQYVAALEGPGADVGKALADRLVALTREVLLFDGDLAQGNADDDAIYDLIVDRLGALSRQQASVPHKERSMRDDRYWPRDGRDPEKAFAGRLESAWDDYVKGVTSLGPLTDEKTPSSRVPPNLEKLAEDIVYGRATRLDCPLIEPLIKIAEYGQRLLVHHLDGQLAVTFEPYNDKYPVVDPDDARDDPRTLERLSKLEVLAPGEFLKLLREVDRFEGRYGELYQTVDPNSRAHATLKKCREWVSFLYGEGARDLQDREPDSLKLTLTVARSQEGTNVFSAYNGFTIGLPLLDQDGDRAVGLIRVYPTRLGIPEGRTVVAPGRKLDFRWSLFASAKSYPVTSARVFDKAPDALPVLPDELTTRWELRRNPWSLLLLIGAKQENELDENRWRIPIKIRVEADGYAETYLYDVFVQFEERHRFPGPIWPLGSAGEPPRMDSASRYLEPPSPGSGRDTRSERRPG